MTIAACFVSFIYGGWFLIIKWAAVGGGGKMHMTVQASDFAVERDACVWESVT